MEAERGLLPRFDNFLVENVVKIPAAQPDKAGKTVCLPEAKKISCENLQWSLPVYGEIQAARIFWNLNHQLRLRAEQNAAVKQGSITGPPAERE